MPLTSDIEYCQKKHHEEKRRYDYNEKLRSADSRCVNHSADLRSSCAGCRAAAWMDMKTAMENESKQENVQPSISEHQGTTVHAEDSKPTVEVKEQSIRMPNIIKSER